MSDSKLRGVFVPMITVFKEDGSIDEEGIRRQVNFLIENGVHGIIPCGSTGEFIALNLDERKRVAKIVVEEAAGRVPIYVGTAHYRTDKTIELSKHAESIGADGVMIVSPYYLKPRKRDVMEHIRMVSNSIKIPIMFYNNPYYSGIDLDPNFIVEAFRRGYIIAVKERGIELTRHQDLKAMTQGRLKVFYGFDPNAIEALVMSCDGWVAGTANLIPRHCVKVYELVKDGQIEEAKKFWYNEVKQFIDLCTHPFEGDEPPWLAIIKEGLNMIGERGGALIMPVTSLPTSLKETLRKVLKELGYISK